MQAKPLHWQRWVLWASFALLASTTTQAEPSVSLNGSLGQSAALLVINGQLRTVKLGQTLEGVRLLSVDDGSAQVEIEGRRRVLQLGARPVRLGDANDATSASSVGRKIILSSGPGGHFTSLGTINGHTSEFLVDTGATTVSISQTEADRIGLRYRDGKRILTQTANGTVPAHLLTLASVRVGDVEVRNVEAVVMPAQMSHVLLGNSFLNRFQMKRDNETLTLEQRY